MGSESHLRQLIFLFEKKTCHWALLCCVVLYCVALFVVSFDHVYTHDNVTIIDLRTQEGSCVYNSRNIPYSWNFLG